jgi:hypothetical protein
VAVRTNDIALRCFFEQFLRIDTAEHSRHFKLFISWNAMVEVHRKKGKALQTDGAWHIAQLAQQLGLLAAPSRLGNRHMARFNSYSPTLKRACVGTCAVAIRANNVALFEFLG